MESEIKTTVCKECATNMTDSFRQEMIDNGEEACEAYRVITLPDGRLQCVGLEGGKWEEVGEGQECACRVAVQDLIALEKVVKP